MKIKNILIAPDSFKGTLDAYEVCEIARDAILEIDPSANVRMLPMADGGEGITDCLVRLLGGEMVEIPVRGPLGETVRARYGMLPSGAAVIEMAQAAGLPLLGGARDPLHAATYGVGEMLLDARARGAREILLGIGGSATNDMGIGMAAAIGFRFLDTNGKYVEPVAANMRAVARVLPPDAPFDLPVTCACDVDNPLLGARGATAVYGSQKGVTADTYELLERGLENLIGRIDPAIADIPGAGAAGGLGAGVIAFLQGRLVPGAQLVLDAARFDDLLADIDLVITGEGRMDAQSINGKVPCAVGMRCQRAGVPCVAVCGSLGEGWENMHACGVCSAVACTQDTDMDRIRRTCRRDLRKAVRHILENV